MFFWGWERRQRVTIDFSEFMTSNIGFAESTLLGFGKEDFERIFVEDEDSA